MIVQHFCFNNNLWKSCFDSPTLPVHKVQRIQPLALLTAAVPWWLDPVTHSSEDYHMVTFEKNISISLCMRQSKPALYLNQNIIHLLKWKKQLSGGNSHKVNTPAVPKQWEVSKSRWKDVSLTLCCFCLIFHCEALQIEIKEREMQIVQANNIHSGGSILSDLTSYTSEGSNIWPCGTPLFKKKGGETSKRIWETSIEKHE